MAFPPTIDITAFRKSISYEFRDPAYAHLFAAENEDAESVMIV
jgi:hypothetical protein